MGLSVFDLFKVGIGPSSSHTVGPMKAANIFIHSLKSTSAAVAASDAHETNFLKADSVIIELYGSLALTGIGHGTDKAVMIGLEGFEPQLVLPDTIEKRLAAIHGTLQLNLGGSKTICFDPQKHIVFFRRKSLPKHPNGLIFRAFSLGIELVSETYYSIGGGFVVRDGESAKSQPVMGVREFPYPFKSAAELVEMAESRKLSIAEIVLKNEETLCSKREVKKRLSKIWEAMNDCIDRGCRSEGILPGPLKVKRRAAAIYQKLSSNAESALRDPLSILDWVNLYALAVNEENAAGSRVVTAPTNGAAGIIPAVIRYYLNFCQGNVDGVHNMLLTAGAIGNLYLQNASISGAEVGCQGEVGVACSMAAGALCAVLGGSVRQVEEAAEIGMEHNLGLTCDPIGGLVQIPCIERNAMGAVKAINAARIALRGSGTHYVSLDNVIKTMRQTGADMKNKYKETSRGGLAVNVIEC